MSLIHYLDNTNLPIDITDNIYIISKTQFMISILGFAQILYILVNSSQEYSKRVAQSGRLYDLSNGTYNDFFRS